MRRLVSRHRWHLSVIVPVLATLVGFYLLGRPGTHTTAQTTSCSGLFFSPPSTVGPGPATLQVSASPSVTTAIQYVDFMIDGSRLGRGMQGTTNQQWTMVWYPQVTSGGSHSVMARVGFVDGTTCYVPTTAQQVMVTTTTSTTAFNFAITPSGFKGTYNTSQAFSLVSNVSGGGDVTPYTYFDKPSVSLGSITPTGYGPNFNFIAGTTAGSASLSVVAYYGGVSKVISIPIAVTAPTTTTTTTSPTSTQTTTQTSTIAPPPIAPTTTSTTTSPVPTSTTGIPLNSSASVESDTAVKDCVKTKLGDVRYVAISSGQSRLTGIEVTTISPCFAKRNYLLPNGYVPVPPQEIKSKPQTSAVKVAAAENVSVNKSTVLRFRGNGTPNTTILLYVFSDPLVFSTQVNSNGEWSYTLDDPLEPGNHEAIAMVNQSDGTYKRSSVFGFGIKKAEASTTNPNGYGLQLVSTQPSAKEDNVSVMIYIAAFTTIIAVALGVVLFIVLKRHKTHLDHVTATINAAHEPAQVSPFEIQVPPSQPPQDQDPPDQTS